MQKFAIYKCQMDIKIFQISKMMIIFTAIYGFVSMNAKIKIVRFLVFYF